MEIRACIGVLCPFLFHLFLWVKPQIWVDLCGRQRDPCRIMALVSLFLKLIQIATLFSASDASWPPPLIFWPFFIYGQLVNFRVYERLGESGMYYGERFGKIITLNIDRNLANVRYCGKLREFYRFAHLGSIPLHCPMGDRTHIYDQVGIRGRSNNSREAILQLAAACSIYS